MENRINIKLKSKRINYDLEFHHRINIVRGDSASGKSTFIRLLDSCKGSNIQITSNYKLLHITPGLLEFVKDSDNSFSNEYVYIIDNVDVDDNKDMIKLISHSPYKFIIMTRELNLNNLSYKINQIYEIYKSENTNLSRQMHSHDKNNNLSWER